MIRSTVNISGNTIFAGNSATDGGVYAEIKCTARNAAVYSWTNVIISEYTTFIYNSARGYGGGMYASSDSTVNISGNTTFIGNSVSRVGHGGGAYIGSKSNKYMGKH